MLKTGVQCVAVPLVSRMLPSDICKIHKKGAAIRLDTTLVDFNDMRWERGDISFLFSGSSKPSHSLTVLDNKLKVYQNIRHEVSKNIYSYLFIFTFTFFPLSLCLSFFCVFHCVISQPYLCCFYYYYLFSSFP